MGKRKNGGEEKRKKGEEWRKGEHRKGDKKRRNEKRKGEEATKKEDWTNRKIASQLNKPEEEKEEEEEEEEEAKVDKMHKPVSPKEGGSPLRNMPVADIAASFQMAVVDVLVEKTKEQEEKENKQGKRKN